SRPFTHIDDILDNLQEPPFLLILDGITDPHNLGAALRVADAMGLHAVIAPKDKSVGLNTTVSKVACGAAETVPYITVTNLSRTMKELKKRQIWIYGTEMDAKANLYDVDLPLGIAWVMGSEGTGMRRLTKENCDVLVSIPMYGTVESLNVSVSTGIVLSETKRQHILKLKGM
ncbi:MAG: 23S rRNA (guanosine(2251)-2'-O)-methyltransferase RlmB, partial [Neisseriaceae bacterium]|nr:23S rRNA (guanosine(2251)-2'-O)-methyltransferase RlmB [Neisseriaceae bacterium]